MEKENIKLVILDILCELHADIEYEQQTGLVDDKILDSFDIVTLVTELGEEFDINITAGDLIPANFNSVDSLANLVSKRMEE